MEPLDDMDQGGLPGGMEPMLAGRPAARPLHQMHQQQPERFEVGWKVCAKV